MFDVIQSKCQQLLVNLRCLFIHSFIKGIAGALESLVEVETINIGHTPDLNYLSDFGHLFKPIVRGVQVECII